MARQLVKAEPVSVANTPRSEKVARTPAVAEAGRSLRASQAPEPRVRATSPTMAAGSTASLERRAQRSQAPTVETLPHVNRSHHSGEDVEGHGDNDELMFMQMRPRVNHQPGNQDNLGGNYTASFMNNPAFMAIGQKLKEVNDTLGTLQSLGIQHVTQLPELVLVGDQSAGKSSIMSAIAGLNLPHNTGVCTRCPIHIRSSCSVGSEWTCRITLQQDYDFKPTGTAITRDDVTTSSPFPPWVKQPRVIKEFMTIRERVDSIERVLRWAQVAVLNHRHNHEAYIPRSLDDDADDADALAHAELRVEAKFSPNTVALEIKGPDLPDLSFYDLPGVFVSARQTVDQYLVNVVENLTREYISHPGAIVLWAVPMNTDPETSTTLRVIREMGADNRTLGVMTKADLLPKGNHDQWVSILKGVDHQTGLGYFITSRPDTGDLDSQTAWEESFFNGRARLSSHSEVPTWPEAFGDFDDRCGIIRLKDFLSRRLAEEFAKSLPLVKNILRQKLGEVESRLKKLPELPPNPELEIRKGLLQFSNLVKSSLKSPEFSTQWGSKAENFKTAILALKPKVIVKPEIATIEVDSEGSANSGPSPAPKRPATDDHVFSTPSKRRMQVNGVGKAEDTTPTPFSFTPQRPGHATPAPGTPSSRPTHQVSRTLPQIRQILLEKRLPGMPNVVPHEVYEFLCMEAVQPWSKPLNQFLNDTMKLLHAEMHKNLDNAFSFLKKRLVFRESKEHVVSFMRSHRETLLGQLTHSHSLETKGLYTINNNFFNSNFQDEKKLLARHRHYYRWAAAQGQQGDPLKPWEQMSEEERLQEQGKMAKEAIKLGKDPFEQELDVVAYVRAYYLTAAYRFIDNVSLHITAGMFPAISESVNFHLDKKLGLLNNTDPAIYDRLMEEEPKTADLRKQLKDDKLKFEKALKSILALEKSSTTSIVGDDDDDDDLMMVDRDQTPTNDSDAAESFYQGSHVTGEVH